MGIRFPIRAATLEAYVLQRHGEPRQLAYAEALILDEFAEATVNAVQEGWPVDTGFSAASFEWELKTEAGRYGFVVTNDAGYVQYVHPAGTPADPPLWRTLIPAVVKALAPLYMPRIQRAIDRTEAILRRRRADLLDLIQSTPEELGITEEAA